MNAEQWNRLKIETKYPSSGVSHWICEKDGMNPLRVQFMYKIFVEYLFKVRMAYDWFLLNALVFSLPFGDNKSENVSNFFFKLYTKKTQKWCAIISILVKCPNQNLVHTFIPFYSLSFFFFFDACTTSLLYSVYVICTLYISVYASSLLSLLLRLPQGVVWCLQMHV